MSFLYSSPLIDESVLASNNIQLLSRVSSTRFVNQAGVTSDSEAYDQTQSERPTIDMWPSKPARISKSWDKLLLDVVLGVLCLAAPLLYIYLTIEVARHDGKVVLDYEWADLQQQIRWALSSYPYVFGFIVARTIRLIARWRLQKGSSLRLLEQLMGSTSVGSTFSTHFQLKPLNIATIMLFVVWSFSPLGTRTLVATITVEPYTIASTTSVKYLDTSQASQFYTQNSIVEVLAGHFSSLYVASLLSSQAVMSSSMDLWGNVKIPNYSRLGDTFKASTDGDISIPFAQTFGVVFTSLMGIPISDIASDGITTFMASTSYVDLDCYNITQGPFIPYSSEWRGASPNTSMFSLAMDGFVIDGYSPHSIAALINATNGSSIPHTLLFQARNSPSLTEYSQAFCNLSQAYVDNVVRCESARNCSVMSQRLSSAPHAPTSITHLNFEYLFTQLSMIFPFASGEQVYGPLEESTATELYISDPRSSFSTEGGRVNLSGVPKADFEARLGQLLNTYYLGSVAPLGVTGNLTADPDALTISARADNTTLEMVYRVHWMYAAFFLASCAVMLVATLTSEVLSWSVVIAPDILGFVSSFTRENPYVRAPDGGSALDGTERTKLLGGMRLRIGEPVVDGCEDEEVRTEEARTARIVIGEEWTVKGLNKGKKYF